jgi:murein L,D-transpeptidase YafK
VDQVVVKKSQRQLQLMNQGKVIREYRIALGDAPVGHKLQEGDERTPVGNYVLDWRNPRSNFHKSIHISYPNERDRAVAEALGVSPGGMIMIHGQPNHIRSHRVKAEYATRDWTDGCIAVQNHEMDEIWRMVRDGTPIRILH